MVKLLAILLLVAPLYATGGGGGGTPGPKGDRGPVGATGQAGRDGVNCVDCACDKNRLNIGGEVVWHEWDNHVGVRSGYRFDVRNEGHTVDLAVVQWRIGKSPEDRQLEALKRKIEALEAFQNKALKATIKGN